MRYAILIQQHPDGMFHASVPVIPGLTRFGKDRNATIRAIQQDVIATLALSEVVYIDVPDEPSINPWLMTAGLFADDSTLESMLDEIYDARDKDGYC